MVVVGLQGDDEGYYQMESRANGGKRIFRYTASILPDLGLDKWLIVELYKTSHIMLIVGSAITKEAGQKEEMGAKGYVCV